MTTESNQPKNKPTLLRTSSDNLDFQNLVVELDLYLAGVNGDSNAFFAQHNQINPLKQVVVAYENNLPIGCGAIKEKWSDTMEVKRMFVLPSKRGRGVAFLILQELETWAKELNYTNCVLETSDQMKDAMGLYLKSGYKIIPNYEPYENSESSVCFQKLL